MTQGIDQLEYLRWKVSFFGSLKGKEGVQKGGRVYRYSFKVRELEKYLCLHSSRTTCKKLTLEILEKMGPLAWLVWYLDDGHYRKEGFIEISCTNLGLEGANLIKEFCLEKFGWDLHVYSNVDKRSNKPYVKLIWHKADTESFFDYVKGLIDIECINYKVPQEYRGVITPAEPKRELVKESLEIQIRELKKEEWTCGKVSDRYRRFNIEVEDNHNYTLPGGLLTSNCSPAALNALLKTVEEGVPNTIFVFCSTEDILPTIKSRSICIDIELIPEVEIIKRVKYVAESRGIQITDAQLAVLASKSQGHMRDALSILQSFEMCGEQALKTSFSLVRGFILSALSHKKEKAEELLDEILRFNIVDIKRSLYVFIKSLFTSVQGTPEYTLLKKNIANSLFGYFFSPQASVALRDEIGIEILFRAFFEKTCK